MSTRGRAMQYADAEVHPDDGTAKASWWRYPVDDFSEPLLTAAGRGPIELLDQDEWIPLPPPPEAKPQDPNQ